MEPDSQLQQRAQAFVAAEEYMRASDNLASLQRSYALERKVLRVMGLLAVPIIVLVVIDFMSSTPEYVSSHSMTNAVLFYCAALLVSLLLGAWVGCFPAGLIGMWRALSHSGWFVWGGWIFMLVVLIVLLFIPVLFGPVFFIRQAWRVHKLKSQLSIAMERRNAAERVVY